MTSFELLAVSITYSECVSVALGIRHAIRMRYIVICGLPALQFFSPHKCKTFPKKKKVIGHKPCALIFSTTFV